MNCTLVVKRFVVQWQYIVPYCKMFSCLVAINCALIESFSCLMTRNGALLASFSCLVAINCALLASFSCLMTRNCAPAVEPTHKGVIQRSNYISTTKT